MVQSRRNENYSHRVYTATLNWITRYNILVNGKHVECHIIGWRTALAHARAHGNDLFEPNKKVEILNLWTGEIVTLEEAEKRVKKLGLCVNDAAISGTT